MSKDRPGIYLLASISKPMTAVGVLLLSERGELALDDMLTYTSGFLDRLNENHEMRKRSVPLLEFVEKAIRTPLLFKLGERYKYQSIGTLLVAEVCQRITKTSVPDYLDSGLFGTLGMKHSVMGLGNIRIQDTERTKSRKARHTQVLASLTPRIGTGTATIDETLPHTGVGRTPRRRSEPGTW